mgnify:CR=1 FL=1|tara:strand:+ start:2303 stop:3943 length:1641 start_codon:yes stop_codon:yes gene_type:complete
MRKIIVTSALPYANGSIHLGHLVEYLQTDIWVRNQKMNGNDCVYICADDAHGTPIMLKAKELNITPEQLIKKIHKEHIDDFADFQIEFDNYHTTHSNENKIFSEMIYNKLLENGDIVSKNISQFYDEKAKMFLPDRYVRGDCPKCGSKNQYGDSCEECGASYSSSEIKNPISTITQSTPITKSTEHQFFKLSSYEKFLKKWVDNGTLQPEIKNKLDEWLSEGLSDWDITRDAPYFGFKIPNTEDKYFYVWLDAPIGYIASYKNFCDKNNKKFNEDWDKNTKTELYHFIGKDIAYFHALFWPAMLEGSGLKKPDAIFCHGFLTIDGEKMSKSRGTFFNARTYLNHLKPEYLRYYFASRLNNKIEDIDLSFDDFCSRVNSELIGKIVNIGSRCAKFINKDFDNKLSEKINNQELIDTLLNNRDKIISNYENREYSTNIRLIASMADDVNKYLDNEKPWIKIKNEKEKSVVQAICTDGLNAFRILMGYLKPVLPKLSNKVEDILDCPSMTWNNINSLLLEKEIKIFSPIITRIDEKWIINMKKENDNVK